MAKFSTEKVISIVAFLLLMFFFAVWVINQAVQLGYVFGFRLSYTVANDIAGRIYALSSLPGNSTIVYSIDNTGVNNPPVYIVTIADKIVCVTSVFNSNGDSTRDCASQPFNMANSQQCKFARSTFTVEFRKIIDSNGQATLSVSDRNGGTICQ